MTRAPIWLRYSPHLAVAGAGYTMFAYAGVPFYYLERFGTGYTAFGLVMSVTLLPFVLVQFPAGWLLGRRTATELLLGACVAHVGLAAILDLSPTLPVLLGLRFLWGSAAGLLVTVGATHVARTHDGRTATRQQGVFGGMLTFGGAAGFLLAPMFVDTFGGLGIQAVGAAIAFPALAALWIARGDRSTAPTAPIREAPPLRSVIGNRIVLLASLCYVAIIGSYITLSTFVTGYFEELGVTGPLNAAALVTASIGRAVGGDSVARWPVGDVGIIGVGTALALVGFGVLAVGQSGLVLVGLPVVVMLAVSVPFGAVFNVAASATSHEGAALATVIAVGNVAALALPAITGAIRDVTGAYRGAFVLLGILNGLALTGAIALAGRRGIVSADGGGSP